MNVSQPVFSVDILCRIYNRYFTKLYINKEFSLAYTFYYTLDGFTTAINPYATTELKRQRRNPACTQR